MFEFWQSFADEPLTSCPRSHESDDKGDQYLRVWNLEKILAGDVKPRAPKDQSFKIPHMGWTTLDLTRRHALLDGIALGESGFHAYFVHSYHFVAEHLSDVIATTDHGQTVTAVVGRDNIAGTQFHPEKSQMLGLTLLANFLRWRP